MITTDTGENIQRSLCAWLLSGCMHTGTGEDEVQLASTGSSWKRGERAFGSMAAAALVTLATACRLTQIETSEAFSRQSSETFSCGETFGGDSHRHNDGKPSGLERSNRPHPGRPVQGPVCR